MSIEACETRRLFAGPNYAFNPASTPPTGQWAFRTFLEDMNADGKLDLISTGIPYHSGAGVLTVSLGNGNGTFQAPIQTTAFGGPDAAATPHVAGVADMNRDGKLDVVIARRDDAAVHIMYGNGNGTLGSPVRTALPSNASFGPTTLAVGDFNGDQWPDVIAGRFDAPNMVILYGGNTFGASTRLVTLNGAPSEVITADFDQDGISDIAATTSGGLAVVAKLNQATQRVSTYNNPWPGLSGFWLAAGRMRGPSGPVGLTAVGNAGGSTPGAKILRIPDPLNSTDVYATDTGFTVTTFASGDFNRDGYSDVVIGTAVGGAGGYIPATGRTDGGLDIDVTRYVELGASPYGSSVQDINGDGYLDVVAGLGTEGVRVLTQVPESLTVTTAIDEDDGTAAPSFGAGVSLREAVNFASRIGGTQTIAFAPNLANATFNLTRGPLVLAGASGLNLTLRSDARRMTINGNGTSTFFYVGQFGTLNLQNLTITNFLSNQAGGNGGAIYVQTFAYLNIDNCTFTGNSASGQGSVVYTEEATRATIRNSTFTANGGNSVLAFTAQGNTFTNFVQHNTIYGNTANGVAVLRGNVHLQNNIIASNGTSDVVYAGGNFLGFNNIIRTGGGPAGSLNVDPLLGMLANNGGPTSTFMPAPNSPAINAAAAIGFTLDQRGTARPQGALPDIGAVERVATAAQLTDASFEYLTRQAVNLTFNAEASVSFSRSNITLTNLTTNQVITAGTLDWNANGTAASLVLTNLLADGNYRLTAGATTVDFFVLKADLNRDRAVNFDDLLILAQNYGGAGDSAHGDTNYDGTVNFDDLLDLSQRYGTTLLSLPTQRKQKSPATRASGVLI